MVFERLAAPYNLTISEGEHVAGRFAGQHLGTAIVAEYPASAKISPEEADNVLAALAASM